MLYSRQPYIPTLMSAEIEMLVELSATGDCLMCSQLCGETVPSGECACVLTGEVERERMEAVEPP